MQTAIEAVADALFSKRELLKVMKANREELINRLTNDHNSIRNMEGLVYRLEQDLSKMHTDQKEEYDRGIKSASGDGCNLSASSKQLSPSETLPQGNSESFLGKKMREG